jgi:homoserine dehydrogenase
MRQIRAGLLGFGTVGRGVFDLLRANADLIAVPAGARVEVVRACVRDLSRDRSAPAALFVRDPLDVACAPDVDVVVEVMGGLEPAGTAVEAALRAGKPVVTANKELIAKRGSELAALAGPLGLDLAFEAAVAGGVPVIGPIRRQLAGDRPRRLVGILNGTTNFILTAMTQEAIEGREASFEAVLAEAQRLGYAEADPASDVDGFDAAYKLAILTSVAAGAWAPVEAVARRGIRGVRGGEVRAALAEGRRVKLVAEAAPGPDGAWRLSVGPAGLPAHHPLAQMDGPANAVCFVGEFVGEVRFIGPGAGAGPTATSVVGDLIEVCRALGTGRSGSPPLPSGVLRTVAPEPFRSELGRDEGPIPFHPWPGP